MRRAAARVAKIIIGFVISTAFMFDLYLIDWGIVALMQGKPFLQGIVNALEDMWVVLIGLVSSLLISGLITYLSER